MSTTPDHYLDMRARYHPDPIKLVIVAESPPKSGKYFYNAKGDPSESLFLALMKQFGISPATKDEGLRHFQKAGWIFG